MAASKRSNVHVLIIGSALLGSVLYVLSATSSASSLPIAKPLTQTTIVGAATRPLQTQQLVRAAKPEVVEQAAFSIPAHPESQRHFGQVAALFGMAAGFIAAAVAFARTIIGEPSEKPEAIALLSTTSESSEISRSKMRQMVESLDSEDMRLISRGASMVDIARSKGIDEVAMTIREDQLSRKDLTPKQVILNIQRGNGRFWMGLSERPDMTAMERRALIMAQAPTICVLSCADSRVPVEIIFDQGLGEVFVVRTAGNILDTNAHGSIEYAVKYLGVKVLMVIGHEACGAVKGAISMSNEDLAKEPFDLQAVLQSIRSNLDISSLNNITDSRSRDREAVVLNTSIQVQRLQQNQLIAQKVADGSLLVCGAFYEISSGIVDLFSLDKNGFLVDL